MMAGQKRDNQHYTPKLLLKGFTILGKPNMTFLYKKKRTRTYEQSIRKIASENHFYKTEDGDNAVDDAITEYENSELKHIIEALRLKATFGLVSIEKERIEKAVLHLWARSRNFRDSLSEPMDAFLDQSSEVFGSTKGLQDLFLSSSSEMVDDKIYDEYIKCFPAASSKPKTQVIEKIKELLSEHPEVFKQMADSTRQELHSAKGLIQPALKSEHISFMSEHEEIPTDRFKDFSWFLVEDPSGSTVFPDCVLMGYDQKEGFRPLILVNNETNVVMLPVSNSRLLVGSKENKIPIFSETHIKQIGRCAFDFFIHPQKSDELDLVKSKIGEIYAKFSNDVVDEALREYR